jgi:hypothetical protein
MQSVVKKIIRIVIACLLLFIAGFASGVVFNRCRSSSNTAGVTADVSGYNTAAQRIEYTARAVEDAARNVSGAQGEVRISIDDVGSITRVAYDIADGTDSALVGTSRITDGVQRIMGILDEAEKRDAKMEASGGDRLD